MKFSIEKTVFFGILAKQFYERISLDIQALFHYYVRINFVHNDDNDRI